MTSARLAEPAGPVEPPRGLAPVGGPVEPVHRAHPQPPQRLRLPPPHLPVGPGQAAQVRVAVEDQVAQGAAGQVGRGQPVADVPPGPAEPGGRIEGHAGAPVAGYAEDAAPRLRERHAGDAREQVGERDPQRLDRPRLRPTVDVRARPEPVGDTAAAERDPAVGGALGVAVGVCQVAEQLAVAPADRVPLLVGQWLGDHHRGVHRQPGAPLAGQPGCVALQAAQHVRRPHGPVLGAGESRLDRGDARLLVDLDAEPSYDVGQALHQPGRLDPGAVGVERAAQGPGDLDPITDLFGRQWRRHLVAQPGQLGGRTRHEQHAVADDVGLDRLGPADADHLIHRGPQLGGEPVGAIDAVRSTGVAVPAAGQLGRQPAAVAA